MKDHFERLKTNPGAVINNDRNGLEAYRKAKKKNAEIDILKKDVDIIKGDIDEIKGLLFKIAEKL